MQPRGFRTMIAVVVLLGTGGTALAGCGGGSGGAPATSPRPARHQSSQSTPDFPSSTSGVPSPTGPAPTKQIALPTRRQRITALQAQAGGQAVVLVAVPGGYEAASYDQLGNLRFWREASDSGTWTQVGASSYPYVPALGPPHARVRGALLSGMQHATFIVYGVFTGDGSGNAVAFTTGANGWGAIKAEPNGNIGPSGQPVGADLIGLSYNFGFAGGRLITEDCPTDRPISQCGTHPIVKSWVWTGSDFALA
ncbi:MAG TPA: hypothetical protein VFH38_05850 [Jatrophihabitans sp.]|nr:hypothetical protein [Jatrophihabitans sp.]